MKNQSGTVLSCPHCGKDDLSHKVYSKCWIQCNSCLATGPVADSPKDAEDLWSRRLLMDIWEPYIKSLTRQK